MDRTQFFKTYLRRDAFHGTCVRDPCATGPFKFDGSGMLHIDRAGNTWPPIIMPHETVVVREDWIGRISGMAGVSFVPTVFRRVYDFGIMEELIEARPRLDSAPSITLSDLPDDSRMRANAPRYFELQVAVLSTSETRLGSIRLTGPDFPALGGSGFASTVVEEAWLLERDAFRWKAPCMLERMFDLLSAELDKEYFHTYAVRCERISALGTTPP